MAAAVAAAAAHTLSQGCPLAAAVLAEESLLRSHVLSAAYRLLHWDLTLPHQRDSLDLEEASD